MRGLRKETREVIFEDELIKVINKSSGVVSESLGRVAHRLDKGTSGVIVLAKTDIAHDALTKQFEERKVRKLYIALVHGIMHTGSGILSEPIMRNPKIGNRFVVGSGGRSAITEWKIIKKFDKYSLLEVRPMTGRTHQIRVHLKHLGHPIVSDYLYGGKQYREDVKWCPRLFLHAKSLEFTHPGTGERVTFESELPNELEDVLKRSVGGMFV